MERKWWEGRTHEDLERVIQQMDFELKSTRHVETLHDKFLQAAITGILARDYDKHAGVRQTDVRDAFAVADALLRERTDRYERLRKVREAARVAEAEKASPSKEAHIGFNEAYHPIHNPLDRKR